MACRIPFNRNNFLRFERVYGGLTLAELQAQGIAALCNPADVAPPYDLIATGGLDDIVLDWTFEGGLNDGFIIYRNTTGVDLQDDPLDVLADKTLRTYTDSTAIAGTLYYYLIVATNNSNLSAPSNIASAEVLNAFTFTVNTATAGTSGVGAMLLPLNANTTNYNLDIYVDGVFLRKVTDVSGFTLTSSELGAAGNKTISLNGTMAGWAFNNGGDRLKLTDIAKWANFNHNAGAGGLTGAFHGCSNLQATITATDAPDFVGNSCTNLQSFFNGCSLFNTNIGSWDISGITNISFMFNNASAFNNGGSSDINLWDTSSVITLDSVFLSASAFNQNISSWNVANVTNMQGTFRDAIAFNQNISSWNVAKVNNMQSTLNGANSFNQNLGSWNTLNTGTRTTITGTTAFSSSSTANGINTTNYDLFLVGQNAQVGTLATVAWGVVNRRYTAAGAGGTARTSLISRGVTFVGDAGI